MPHTSTLIVSRLSLVVLCWWLWTFSISAAPAPVYRPIPPLELDGAFVMTWNDIESNVWFSRQGHFADYYRDQQWLGEWKLKGSVLTVTETPPGGTSITWTATLDPPRRGVRGCAGTLSTGGKFELRE